MHSYRARQPPTFKANWTPCLIFLRRLRSFYEPVSSRNEPEELRNSHVGVQTAENVSDVSLYSKFFLQMPLSRSGAEGSRTPDLRRAKAAPSAYERPLQFKNP